MSVPDRIMYLSSARDMSNNVDILSLVAKSDGVKWDALNNNDYGGVFKWAIDNPPVAVNDFVGEESVDLTFTDMVNLSSYQGYAFGDFSFSAGGDADGAAASIGWT